MKILEQAPNARITGTDLCPAMLDKVRQRFGEDLSRFTLIEGSTVDVPFGEACFDLVISMLHLHFFSTEIKAKIYAKIFHALRTGGKYIGHDLCQTQKQERENRHFYDQFVSTLPGADVGAWNYKQTMSIATQQRLLSEAGFVEIEPWLVDLLPSGIGVSVFVAEKP
jgi:tRNA (cmo5U34)-methyltransferase